MNRTILMNNYWKYYLRLEQKFVDTLDYISLDENNYNTFSNEFALLIQIIGSELDLFFKEFCNFNTDKRKTIKDYANYILKISDDLVFSEIQIIDKDILLKPFSKWELEAPGKSLDWWQAYNEIKHNRTSNTSKATLENSLNLLAALYLLEMKYLLHITKDTNEPDVPNISSKLFVIKGEKRKYQNVGNNVFLKSID